MMDETVVIEATGEQILQALENGVQMWPKLEGRFPQVGGRWEWLADNLGSHLSNGLT